MWRNIVSCGTQSIGGGKSVAKVPNEFFGLLGLTGKDMVHFASILLD